MRLDLKLTELDAIKSRSQARDFIKRGLVHVNSQIVLKPGYEVKSNDLIKIEEKTHFVSRAGEKLYDALLTFNIDLNDKIVIDVGSSTGGFTDCSLRQGAAKVYAYDVGYDQMDETLRLDPKIELHEQTNFLDVDVPDADIVLIDVSFTSILPIIAHLETFKGEMLCLIKPQFEVGHNKFKGVLKDEKVIKHTLTQVLETIEKQQFNMYDFKKADIKGKKGNQEYVLYIKPQSKNFNIKDKVKEVLC